VMSNEMERPQQRPPPFPAFLHRYNRLMDQPLILGDIRAEIYLRWWNKSPFVDVASTLSIVELVGAIMPVLVWPANNQFLGTDVFLCGGQLSRSGGTSISESTSYKPPHAHPSIVYSPRYSSFCQVVRIGGSKPDPAHHFAPAISQ